MDKDICNTKGSCLSVCLSVCGSHELSESESLEFLQKRVVIFGWAVLRGAGEYLCFGWQYSVLFCL